MITNLLSEEIAKKFKLNANFDDEEFKRLARKEDLRFSGDMSKTVRRIRDAVHFHNDDVFNNHYMGIKFILDEPENIKRNLLWRLEEAKEQNDEKWIKKIEEDLILKDYFTKVAKLEGKAVRELLKEKTKFKLENESEPITQEEPKKEDPKPKQEIPATKIELIQKCKQKIEDCFKEINELPQENLIIDPEDWRIKKEIDLEKKALEQIPNIIESFDQACKSDCLEEQNKKYEQLIQIFEENFETINIYHSKKLRIFKRAFVKMLIILDVSETNKICLKQHIFSNLPKMQNNASLTNTKEMIKENIQNPKRLLLPMPKTLILRGLPQKPKELTQQYNNMQNIQNNACLTNIQEVIKENITTHEIEENKCFKTSLQVINNITRIQENPKQPDKIKHTFKLLRTLRKENKKVAKTMKKTLRYILREATRKRILEGV